MNFKQLHQQEHALLIANVWDVPSAQLAQELGFQAIGTSSAAIAATFGYEDGEGIAFSTLCFVVERITSQVSLPLTVDLEAGYSDEPLIIVEHIKQLAALGVVGINIEDSLVKSDDSGAASERFLVDAETFSLKLKAVKQMLKDDHVDIFVNVRTDPFLLGTQDALTQTLTRITLYESAGADGIFIPCVTERTDIEICVQSTSLPINVMYMDQLTNFDALADYGVKRISMGSFVFERGLKQLKENLTEVLSKNFSSQIFNLTTY